MKLGLFGINLGACARPDVAVRVAQAAEAAGFDSVWTGEHVVLPDPQAPPSPAPPRTPFLDPLVALAHLAGHTRRLRLATGIVILPQRNPLVLAKEVASLDVLSGGRAVLGVGAGYLHQEFAALGVPFARRGERTDEYIDALRALWSQEKPAFAGRFAAFSGIDAQPRPVQRPGAPIVVGGTSPGALRRAVARGNGCTASRSTRPRRRAASRASRRPPARSRGRRSSGGSRSRSRRRPAHDAAAARRYAELGVDRLALLGMLPGRARAPRADRRRGGPRGSVRRVKLGAMLRNMGPESTPARSSPARAPPRPPGSTTSGSRTTSRSRPTTPRARTAATSTRSPPSRPSPVSRRGSASAPPC